MKFFLQNHSSTRYQHIKSFKYKQNLGIKYPLVGIGPQIRFDRPNDKKFKTLKHQDFWYSFIRKRNYNMVQSYGS